MGQPIARVVDGRRQQVAQRQSSSGGVIGCEGHVDIAGSGTSFEVVFDVVFPVRYTELPLFSPGYSLADNQAYELGSLPDWSATVLKWEFDSAPATGERYYDGATVGFVVTGLAGQRGVGHYKFEGVALVGPAGR